MTFLKNTAIAFTLGATGFGSTASADVVHLDDVIITGSLCVGFDCNNGETFGFDTIRLKENNVRIKFDDTSASASFPNRDWQLTANDSTNGGANKFSIEDITGGRIPFTIEAGAPNNSLFVDDGGRLGLGTATPVVEIHTKNGDSPTLRLEQDGSSGFAAQTWDVAGNETNFFVRDVSNGSTLPFRIRPGAPSSAIDIAADGDVGIGTTSPGTLSEPTTATQASLHVRRTNGKAAILVEEASTTAAFKYLLELSNNAGGGAAFRMRDNSTDIDLNNIGGDFRINFDDGDGPEFDLGPTGALTISGALTQNSDKNNKMAIQQIEGKDILAKVAALPISAWTYKHDADSKIRHIGPMAQDFYHLFGTGATEKGISTIDTAGVALAAIKELNLRVDTLLEQSQQQEKTIAELRQQVVE